MTRAEPDHRKSQPLRFCPAWGRRLRLVPGLLLLAVALHQLYLAHIRDLSPWSGGGFGMFSTADAGGRRHLHAFLVQPGILREVEPPRSLEPLTRRALTLPTSQNLQTLARALAELPTPDAESARSVRIQVWRTRFDAETLAPRAELLRELEVALAGD